MVSASAILVACRQLPKEDAHSTHHPQQRTLAGGQQECPGFAWISVGSVLAGEAHASAWIAGYLAWIHKCESRKLKRRSSLKRTLRILLILLILLLLFAVTAAYRLWQ
jgi:hypothetical protein